MRTTARIFGFVPAGTSRRIALALLGVAALSAGLSGCGAGSEALPSDLPPPAGGGALLITTSTMEDGVINRSYSKTLDTTGGTPPLIGCTFSAGTPPPGLNIAPSGSTCVVSGTPTMAGSFTFQVRAEDSNNISDTQDYTLVIRDEFTITGMAPDPLPDGVEDAAYNFMFTVTTDTVIGPNDVNQVAENGNGPITMCTLGGLPAGMMAVGGTFTANMCTITISGAPNIGLGPMSAPVTFMLTLTVVDTGIGGSSTPAGMVTQTAIDLTIQPPVSITLITTDPASVAGCTGGTFDDSTGGGAAPEGVNGRTYGDPQCDLLFHVTGGIAPYAWTDNSAMPPAPFGCVQELPANDFFRCNSAMAALMTAGGTTTDVTVEVMDSGSAATAASTQGTDIFGHASHSIFVNDEVMLASDLGDPLPTAVMGQPYGEAPNTPATFTASGGLGAVTGFTFNNPVGGTMGGDTLFPTTIQCNPTAPDVLTCATNVSNITAAVGNYTPTVTADDVANDTTPDSNTAGTTVMVTVGIEVVALPVFTLITADAATTNPCSGGTFVDMGPVAPDAVTGRTYGDPECDLLFQVTGGRPPFTWATTVPAPAPIACAQEGADNEFFRCNSGGAGVSGGAAALAVSVMDTGNAALGPVTRLVDDQVHGNHLITVRDGFAVGSFMSNPPGPGGGPQAGVTGRPYGTPGGTQDLVISIPANTGIGPVTMTPDENTVAGSSATAGFPNDLDCVQTIDRQIECTTGAGVIVDAPGIYSPILGAADTGNDTTPSSGISGNIFNIRIVDEIIINPVLFTNGIVGQPYSHTLSCVPVLVGRCGGTGNPDFFNAVYTWFEVGGPANPDITVSTTVATNPSTGQYSGTPTAANTGTFMPTISVTDDGNNNTPSCQTAMTCPTVMPVFNIFDAVAAIDASNNEVDIFDTNTNTFNAAAFGLGNNVTVDAGSTPFRSAFTPNGTFLVVVDPAESQVDIIEVKTGAITNVGSGAAGDPTGVTIGPDSNPLTNPDAWFAYLANPTFSAVTVLSVDPAALGSLAAIIPIAAAKDVAITPTFAGPQTRVYVLSGTDDVCVIDAQPGSPTFLMQIDLTATIGTPCIDTSAIPGDTQFIEITPNGLQALITKHDGVGAPAGAAQLVRIDTDPTSPMRDTVTANTDLGITLLVNTTFGCFLPNDLRSDPASGSVIVACGTDTVTGDVFVAFDPVALGFLGAFPVTAGDDPQDVAFTINGSEAVGTLKGVSSIRLLFGASTLALPNVTAPDGVDHIRDPQLNALISAAFPIQVGQPATRAVTARGGVQPYTFADSSGALGTPGTACQGLSLDSRTGRISGVPMQPGTCTFTVTVSDSNGQSRTVEGRIEVKP